MGHSRVATAATSEENPEMLHGMLDPAHRKKANTKPRVQRVQD